MATEPKTKAAEPPGDPLAPLYGVAPVVVARAESLQPLQALCHDEDDVVPTLLTARYRLRSGPVFGNLLVAFANDVRDVPDPARRSATCSPPRGPTRCGRSSRRARSGRPSRSRAVASASSGCRR